MRSLPCRVSSGAVCKPGKKTFGRVPSRKTLPKIKLLSLTHQNNYIMGAAQIREALHQFINHADERVLNLLYDMMKANTEGTLTTAQQADLDKRIARHKTGKSESYSRSEARAQIEKRA